MSMTMSNALMRLRSRERAHDAEKLCAPFKVHTDDGAAEMREKRPVVGLDTCAQGIRHLICIHGVPLTKRILCGPCRRKGFA